MIFQHTWEKILSGDKTQTRRIVKEREFIIGDAVRHQAQPPLKNTGRTKWQAGKTYAVQQGRGKSALWIYRHCVNLPCRLVVSDSKPPANTHWYKDVTQARITITEIRQERLQDITEDACVAEGIPACAVCNNTGFIDSGVYAQSMEVACKDCKGWVYEQYANLWDSINTRPGTRWQDNPMVWVLSFKIDPKFHELYMKYLAQSVQDVRSSGSIDPHSVYEEALLDLHTDALPSRYKPTDDDRH